MNIRSCSSSGSVPRRARRDSWISASSPATSTAAAVASSIHSRIDCPDRAIAARHEVSADVTPSTYVMTTPIAMSTSRPVKPAVRSTPYSRALSEIAFGPRFGSWSRSR